MRDEWSGVYPTLLYQAKNLLAVTTVHATGLEGQVLSIHVWQRQDLWLVIKGNYRYYRIRTGTFIRVILEQDSIEDDAFYSQAQSSGWDLRLCYFSDFLAHQGCADR